MNLRLEEETLLRWRLLGAASPEEDERLAQRWPDGSDDVWRLVEADLIDDYVRGALPAHEQELFEQNFLDTPERRQQVRMARAALKEAARYHQREAAQAVSVPTADVPVVEPPRVPWRQGWWQPAWGYALAGLLLLVGGGLFWQWRRGASNEAAVMQALNQAYRTQRPIEARISGLDHAPYRFSVQMGAPSETPVDAVALERAQVMLFGTDATASASGRGRYYLLQQKYETAVEQFQLALQREPQNARLHSDLGAAWLGRITRDRLTTAGRRAQDVDACLTALNRALELDAASREALFNRALLQQHERLRRQAQADWQRYLQLDSASPWAEEARQHLKEVEAELQKIATRRGWLEQEFQTAWQAGDEARALRAFGLSYSFNGNALAEQVIDELLAARLKDDAPVAASNLKRLDALGRLTVRQTQDAYWSDVARVYRQATRAQLAQLAQARRQMNEAYGFYQRAENDQAVARYEQARQLFEKLGDTPEALFAEAWIGHCHHQRADTVQNLRTFTRLTPVLVAKRYRWMQSNVACGLANGHEAQGRLSDALADAVRCGELAAQTGDQLGELRSLYMRCNFYRELGRHAEVLRLAQQGLALADQAAAETRYTISFYQSSARSLGSLGRFEMARAFQQETLGIAQETRSPRLAARAHIHLGLLYGAWRKYDEALASLQKGIAMGRQLQAERTGQEFVHYGLLHLGNVYRAAGRYPEALQAFQQVAEFFHVSGRQIFHYAAARGRLLTLIAQGEIAAAGTEIDQVIALYEKYRTQIQEDSNRNSFFDQEQDIYDVAIALAHGELHDDERALWYSELCRARSLLDMNGQGWQLAAGAAAPEVTISGNEEPATPTALRAQLPALVQLVEYAVLEDQVLIWVLTADHPQPRSRAVPIARAVLTEKVQHYLASLSRPPAQGEAGWREPAQELYDLLLQPVAEWLDPRKQLCLVPDKLLTRLPFGTLRARATGRLLLEDYTVSYAASANVFVQATQQARQKQGISQEQVLAMGNPQFDRQAFPALPELLHAEETTRQIAGLYPAARLLTGAQATRSAFRAALRQSDVVHVTAHYVTDAESPLLSRLPLAPDPGGSLPAALQTYEFYQLGKLPSRLVVLAACQTSGEAIYGGEGAIGLARPFAVAGVPLVIASLWPVDEPATNLLMLAFHRARRQGGQASATALRNAQLALLREQPAYEHPYYWAAFTAIGGYCEY
jgi:CHAT domain-containing protein